MLIILQISNVSVLSLLLIVPYGALRSSLWEHFQSITLTAAVGVIFIFLVSFRHFKNHVLASGTFIIVRQNIKNTQCCDLHKRAEQYDSWLSTGNFHTNTGSFLFPMRFGRDGRQQLSATH